MKITTSLLAPVLLLLFFSTTTQAGEEQMIAEGKKVKFDYKLTVDGNLIEDSAKAEPLQYTHGQKQIIPGLEKELEGLKVGDAKSVTIPPEEAYGNVDPSRTLEVPIEQFGGQIPQAGMGVTSQGPNGESFQATVKEVGEKTAKLDFNHPLAGKTLQFDVKIIEIA